MIKAKMIKAKKSLGQHFLIDTTVIDTLLNLLNIQPNDHIIEIGPGKGALTRHLVKSSQSFQLDLIELDDRIIPHLKETFIQPSHTNIQPNIRLHHQDVLKTDWHSFSNNKVRLVGNLPYQISTPLLFQLLNHRDCFQDMLFMLQKEVVDRITAPHNSKAFGKLSVMIQAYFDTQSCLNIFPDSFDPPPKVDSALVLLKPNNRPLDSKLFKNLQIITQSAFQQRRKTVRNSLKPWRNLLSYCHIDLNMRAENISVEQYVKLATQPLAESPRSN